MRDGDVPSPGRRAQHPPITEGDILESSELFRAQMDYYSHAKDGRQTLTRLAETQPTTLARMHGGAWRGDGAAILLAPRRCAR
jgi:hypothetical protein